MKDELGNRMKEYYENRTKLFLPRRTYTIIRIDGKAFHTYTKKLKKPFDDDFMNDMNDTAKYLCEEIQGAKFAFVQSDEISILLTDFDKIQTDAWFNGNIQKITSVSSSKATSKFNHLRQIRYIEEIYKSATGITTITYRQIELFSKIKLAEFDSRVFTIPSKTEVENYFIWRQQDTVKNSISSLARSLSTNKKQLKGLNSSQLQELCFEKGVNWNDLSIGKKRGRLIVKKFFLKEEATRTKWVTIDPPIFTQNREFLNDLIPEII